jgi:hypothetical protein
MKGQAESTGISVSQAIRRNEDNMDALEECLAVKELNLFYGDKQALQDINLLILIKRLSEFICSLVL